MTLNRAWSRRIAAGLLVAAAVGFIVWTVVDNWRQLSEFDWKVRPGLLALSVAAHVGVLAWGVFVWSRTVRYFGVRDAPFPSLLRIWSISNGAKYVPGVVWQFLAAARLAGASGLSQVVTVSSLLAHTLFALSSACVVAVATLPLERLGLPAPLAWALRVTVPLAAIAGVHPRLINRGLRLAPRALHREPLAWHGSWLDGIGILLLQLVSWTLYGVAYQLFLLSLARIPLGSIVAATGVNALSFAAGLLVPVPGGMGVRESAMTLLLTPILPSGVAAIVSVLARLWSIVAELALVAIALAWRGGVAPGPESRV